MAEKYSENTYAAVNVQHSYYGIDLEGGEDTQRAAAEDLEQRIAGIVHPTRNFPR